MKSIGAAAASIALLSGCVTMGGGSGPTFPPEVQSLEHEPTLSGDDTERRLGAKPVYALLDRPAAPPRKWRLLQLSHRSLQPQRDNQEVIVLDTELRKAYPNWVAGSYQFNTDPVTGKRSGFMIDAVVSNKSFGLEKEARNSSYRASNSQFAAAYYKPRLGQGTSSTFLLYWNLDTVEFRSALVETDLLAKARAFKNGDQTWSDAPAEGRPLSYPDQIWLVTPRGREVDRFYFAPTTFHSASGAVVEEGSALGVQAKGTLVPLGSLVRVNSYRMTTIDAYGSLPSRTCSNLVVEAQGSKPTEGGRCGDRTESAWIYAFVANSPSLGKVEVRTAQGRRYDSRGKFVDAFPLQLDNRHLLDIRVLSPQEVVALKPRLH